MFAITSCNASKSCSDTVSLWAKTVAHGPPFAEAHHRHRARVPTPPGEPGVAELATHPSSLDPPGEEGEACARAERKQSRVPGEGSVRGVTPDQDAQVRDHEGARVGVVAHAVHKGGCAGEADHRPDATPERIDLNGQQRRARRTERPGPAGGTRPLGRTPLRPPLRARTRSRPRRGLPTSDREPPSSFASSDLLGGSRQGPCQARIAVATRSEPLARLRPRQARRGAPDPLDTGRRRAPGQREPARPRALVVPP